MATIAEIKELALHAAKRTAPTEFTVDSVDQALQDELNGLASSINEFMRNRYDIYDIIITTADEVVPNKVISALGAFAEIQQVPQGQKAIFKRGTLGKNRAKKFLTQVGLSGVYETFRLDTDTFTLEAKAVGGAGTIDFERMLDGAERMSDVMEIVTEGLTDAVYNEVQKALVAAANDPARPDANKVISAGFEADKMFKLLTVVKNYGGNAVIFATPEFVGEMGPDAIVLPGANYAGVYHPEDIDNIHKTGYIKTFRGAPIVEIPQSFIDENNEKTWINPQFAYVLPSGKEKIVKVVLEGQTQVYDWINKDNSMEIHTYKKMGVAILTHYNWGVYQNTNIPDTSENVYGF